MEKFEITERNKVKRVPNRGHYDQDTLYAILDDAKVCHVAFTMEGQPYVIPMIFGRKGDMIFLHGATSSRLMKNLAKGIRVCVGVTLLDGMVVARSAFHSSMNYRSAVIYGVASEVLPKEKLGALKIISDHMLEDRWPEYREPKEKELKATTVLRLKIEQASSKIRTGPPIDDDEDYSLPVWAGVLPITQIIGTPQPDPQLNKDLDLPESIMKIMNQGSA